MYNIILKELNIIKQDIILNQILKELSDTKKILKEKKYIHNPQDAPKDKRVETGERGGIYYESEGQSTENIPKDDKLIQPEGYKSPEELSLKELWANAKLASNYKEGTDAGYLIGKHYLTWGSDSKAYLHELKMIPIKNIKWTSEDLKLKTPIYSNLDTQAPPVDVTIKNDGIYRLFNRHRRLITAKAQGKKVIFAEIYHELPFNFSKYK